MVLSLTDSRVARLRTGGTANTDVDRLRHVQGGYDVVEDSTGQIGASQVSMLQITPCHITVLLE